MPSIVHSSSWTHLFYEENAYLVIAHTHLEKKVSYLVFTYDFQSIWKAWMYHKAHFFYSLLKAVFVSI